MNSLFNKGKNYNQLIASLFFNQRRKALVVKFFYAKKMFQNSCSGLESLLFNNTIYLSGSQTFLERGPLKIFLCSVRHKFFLLILWVMADHLSSSRGPLVVHGADFGNH